MSLSELLKQQQELLDKIYPPQLRAFHETLKTFQKLRPIVDYKPIFQDAAVKEYINAFEKINALTQLSPAELKMAFDVPNLAAVDYDLLIEESEAESVVVVDESKKLQQIITDIYKDGSHLYKLQPREFEELIAELLLQQGYKVELTKQTRDNGYDILAILHLGYGHTPLKFLVECKRYSQHRGVGIEIVRSFKEVIDTEKANRGIIVTSSYFTSEAIKKKEQIPYVLDYRDKDDVMDWVRNYYTERLR